MSRWKRAAQAGQFFMVMFSAMYVMFFALRLMGLFGHGGEPIAQPAWAGVMLIVSMICLLSPGEALRRSVSKKAQNWRQTGLAGAAAGLASGFSDALVRGITESGPGAWGLWALFALLVIGGGVLIYLEAARPLITSDAAPVRGALKGRGVK